MLQRMLIDKMENRILVGIIMFVGTMVLVGWVAINENARMSSFDRHFQARSIERGGLLFTANCATCHGADGRGIELFGPALNSPHLFGFDFFAEINNRLALLEEEEAALNAELAELADELVAEGTTQTRQDEILTRRGEISERISGEEGILVQRAALLEEQLALADQMQPAVDQGYPMTVSDDGVEVVADRLTQINWAGTRYDFIYTTLVHGRPTSISYWEGNQMVAWSDRAGGPLRDDELRDLTEYILNWDKGSNWTVQDLLAVNQFAIVPGVGGVDAAEADPAAGTNVEAIVAQIESGEVVGDPVRGMAIYNSQERSGRNSALGCSGCHAGAVAAPDTELTWDATIEVRLNQPELAGYTALEYVIESIVLPGAYIVPGYAAGAMPSNFGERMTVQDMADVSAYLQSYSELDPLPDAPPAADNGDAGEADEETDGDDE